MKNICFVSVFKNITLDLDDVRQIWKNICIMNFANMKSDCVQYIWE